MIEQAKGVLMAAPRCSPDEAFEMLRERSQGENRKLRDVAIDVVRSIRPDADSDVATLAAVRAARGADLSVLELWLAYFGVGGNHDRRHVAAYLSGDGHEVDPVDHEHRRRPQRRLHGPRPRPAARLGPA